MNKENEKPSEENKVKNILSKLRNICNSVNTQNLSCVKDKKNFKGEFIIFLKKSNKIIILLQLNEIELHILNIKDDFNITHSKKIIEFPKQDTKIIIKKIIASPDEKLIAFFAKKDISVKVLSEIEESKEKTIVIKILHSCLVKNAKYLSFKFSNFDNHYGLLDSTNFRLYEFGNSLSICDINLIGKSFIKSDDYNQKIKNFSFGPKHNFGWQKFSIFFMSSKGEIFVVCPIFLINFQLHNSYLDKNLDFHNNSNLTEEDKKRLKLANISNTNLLKNIKESIEKKDNFLHIKSNKYLLEMNKNPQLSQIIVLDKRDSKPFKEFLKIFEYNDIIVLDSFPILILRKSDLGLIDIILLNDLLFPIRTDDARNFNRINSFLMETIILPSRELLVNSAHMDNLSKLRVKTTINTSFFNKSNIIYVNYLNDVIKIEITYMTGLNSFYFEKTVNEIEMIMKAKVYKIFKYNYSTILDSIKKNNFNEILGYYGILFSKSLNAVIYSIENSLEVDHIEYSEDVSQIQNHCHKLTNLLKNPDIPKDFDYKLLFENIKNSCKIELIIPDVVYKKIHLDIEEDIKNLNSLNKERVSEKILKNLEEMMFYYEKFFKINEENFEIKFKNMKFIFSQTNEIIELMDPSLKQIKKNIEEINKLDEKTKKKKKIIEDKLEKFKDFTRKMNDWEPQMIQNEIHLQKNIKNKNLQMHNLETKLQEIKKEYEKIFESKKEFPKIPTKNLNSELKKKILNLKISMSNIWKCTQNNIKNLEDIKKNN